MRFLLLLFFVICAYSAPTTEVSRSVAPTRKLQMIYDTPFNCVECLGPDCFDPYPLNQTCTTVIGCFSLISLIFNGTTLAHAKGCYRSDFMKLLACYHVYPYNTTVVQCCEDDLCNKYDGFPSIPAWWDDESPENSTTNPTTTNSIGVLSTKEIITTDINSVGNQILYVVIPAVAFVVVMAIVISCLFRRIVRKRLLSMCPHQPDSNTSPETIMPESSGSGMINLTQRCISQDVILHTLLGQGRHGQVFHGSWHGEDIAVKIFHTKDEVSWRNEINIYTKIALHHENVLGFRGSLIAGREGAPQMWILTIFHEQGSLYNFLVRNTVTHAEMMKLVRSICSGLFHLHIDYVSQKGKPAIAHRDLKTTNILLTSHGTCVIADFGLAIVKTEFSSDEIQIQVGTKRYMAPEILDSSIRINSFESFKKADIYALGLVMWEVCSRCILNGAAEAYRQPFEGYVPSNPDFEDMKKVVCIESKRPKIPESWSFDKTLSSMSMLIRECWHTNPEARPTVTRVKKSLDKISAAMALTA